LLAKVFRSHRKVVFFMANTSSRQKGVVPSKQSIYESLARHVPDAIAAIEELLQSRNESIRLGAIKLIMDKCVPDLRATELTGEGGGEVLVRLITEADAKSNSGSTDQELPESVI
jgi:hypothetical protein